MSASRRTWAEVRGDSRPFPIDRAPSLVSGDVRSSCSERGVFYVSKKEQKTVYLYYYTILVYLVSYVDIHSLSWVLNVLTLYF